MKRTLAGSELIAAERDENGVVDVIVAFVCGRKEINKIY